VVYRSRPMGTVPSGPSPGPHNDLTDVAGVRVGHHQRSGAGWLTGTTVVLPPPGSVAGVDVRGGGPSTRETDALSPMTLVQTVDAVVFSGGSSYGLAASVGVTDFLGEQYIGFPVGPTPEEVVPIVAAACLFDLGAGGRFDRRPDAEFGRAAARAATTGKLGQGSVGAGTGAHAGALKGGIGSASVVLDSGITVAALVALNSSGEVADPETGELYGMRHLFPGEIPGLRRPSEAQARAAREALIGPSHVRNTLLATVATDAALTSTECTRLAYAGHDGMARAVQPIHQMTDGDVAFSFATGTNELPGASTSGAIRPPTARPGQLSALMAAAADAVTRAIVHAVIAASSAGQMVSYLERYPSAISTGKS
jgi:putative pantetheine hydrolase